MLSEQLGKEVLSISVSSAEISLDVLKAVVNAINTHIQKTKSAPQKFTQGYQSLKSLNNQNQALQDIPLSSKDLGGLKRELKSYGVDFALKKDLTQPNGYKLYFKGKDAVQIENALKNHMARQFSNDQKPSLKELIKKAIEKSSPSEKSQAKEIIIDKTFAKVFAKTEPEKSASTGLTNNKDKIIESAKPLKTSVKELMKKAIEQYASLKKELPNDKTKNKTISR